MARGIEIKRLIKITVVCALLLYYSGDVLSQNADTALVWKGLEDRYDSFYEIEPHIVNEFDVPIYFDSYFSPVVDLERFDERSNSWAVSRVWHCGTGYKPRVVKVKPMKHIRISLLKEQWDELIYEDSVGFPKFKQLRGYDGSGKYRLKLRFGLKKEEINILTSYSPEFMVIESEVLHKSIQL